MRNIFLNTALKAAEAAMGKRMKWKPKVGEKYWRLYFAIVLGEMCHEIVREVAMIRKMIDAHKFFCRKSQHYVLGNWTEYQKLLENGRWNERLFSYYVGFLPAYFRFMMLSLAERGKR